MSTGLKSEHCGRGSPGSVLQRSSRTSRFFELVLGSATVTERQKGGFGPSGYETKNSVPDSDFRDRFDDWVVGRQFEPDYLHHPVFRVSNSAGDTRICLVNSGLFRL